MLFRSIPSGLAKLLPGLGRLGGGGAGGLSLGGAASGVKSGSGQGGTGILDLTNMPGSVDFWVRFRTYPETTNKEGMAILIDAGAEEERNGRLVVEASDGMLLYAWAAEVDGPTGDVEIIPFR